MNPTASTDHNKTIVRRLYEEASNRNDEALMAVLVSPDFTTADGARGPKGYARAVAILRAGMPDVRFTIQDLVAEGDRVAVRWTFEGTHTGVFRGFPPTNKTIHNEGIAIYQVRADQVVAASLQTDRLGILQQLGAVPPGLGAAPPPKND